LIRNWVSRQAEACAEILHTLFRRLPKKKKNIQTGYLHRAPTGTQRSGSGGKTKKKSVRRMKKALWRFSSPQDFF